MKAVEIGRDIYWVGAVDWKVRDFHGYRTPMGSTYNAYLITGDRTVLVDTVKRDRCDEMLQRIRSVTDPGGIDIIVTDHVEMDHSGSLPAMVELNPSVKVVTSPNGKKALAEHYDLKCAIDEVSTGDKLDLGDRRLEFVLMPMVHWPDSMAAYMPEERVLFSNDAFGQHLATSERFDDELSSDMVMRQAERYYANIVLPCSGQVAKTLEALAGVDVDMIAPSHGVIWREGVRVITDMYSRWSRGYEESKAVVVYDSMWGATEIMAESVMSALEESGLSCVLRSLRSYHISDIMTDVLTAGYVAVGSPTLNRGVMPSVAGFMSYMKGLRPFPKRALAFGSYGWSGESVSDLAEGLDSCGFDLMGSHKIRYRASEGQLSSMESDISSRIGESMEKEEN